VAATGPALGAGHAARALSLAEALFAQGAAVTFELDQGELEGELAARFAQLGLRPGTAPDDAIVVVDLPELGAARHLASPDRLVVFDDRDAFSGRATIVVQPSLPRWSGSGVSGRVLAGYEYAPVGRRFRDLRDDRRRRPAGAARGRLRTVLVCFGGSDPDGVTERLADALARGSSWRATAIVGGHHRPAASLPIEVVRDPADLADRIADCDLALIGGGTMKFEVACLGRPSMMLAAADDQLAVGPPFAATGAAVWLGDGRTVDPDFVRRAVEALVVDDERLATIADRALAVVDGRGADRIASTLLELAAARS
jgi:spore coat polysaccharide biosynthesis predicted glycosyltransferase SpsG